MELLEVKEGETVFKQGDVQPNGKFYIVLEGKCEILILKDQAKLEQQVKEK